MCALQGLKTGKNIQGLFLLLVFLLGFFSSLNSVAFETSVGNFKKKKRKKDAADEIIYSE